MDLPDPDVQTGPWDVAKAGVQRNFDALADASGLFGGKSVEVRFGTDTLTYPGGSVLTNVKTITHGLGRTPVAVVAVGAQGSTQGIVAMTCENVGATTFDARAQDVSAIARAAGFQVSLFWFAVG